MLSYLSLTSDSTFKCYFNNGFTFFPLQRGCDIRLRQRCKGWLISFGKILGILFLFRVAHCVSANLPMCNMTVRFTHRKEQTVNLSDKIYPVDSEIHMIKDWTQSKTSNWPVSSSQHFSLKVKMTKNIMEYYQLVFYLFFSSLLFILFIQLSTVMNGNNFFTLQF